MIKVAMVDDHKMFREGVKSMVEKNENYKMIWMASNGEEAFLHVKTQMPDVLLMDISIGFESGITLTKQLVDLYPDINIIALSMHHEKPYIINIYDKGAKGYILKDAGSDEVLEAIEAVANGKTYFSKIASDILGKT